MRRLLTLMVPLALLAVAPPAAAQDAPELTASAEQPPLLTIGQEATAATKVQFCYRAAGAVPATITVSATGPAWLAIDPEPREFQGTTSGQRCGSRDVTFRLTAGRDAPAFTPGEVEVHLASRATSGTSEANVTFHAQVDYASEVRVEPPPRARVTRGDLGTIKLTVITGANDGTTLEITGAEPTRTLNLVAQIVTTSAGQGLDKTDRTTIPLTVTVSPGAQLGVQRITLNVSAHNAKSPATVGASTSVPAEVEVLGSGGPTPGVELPMALGSLGALALLARRRAR